MLVDRRGGDACLSLGTDHVHAGHHRQCLSADRREGDRLADPEGIDGLAGCRIHQHALPAIPCQRADLGPGAIDLRLRLAGHQVDHRAQANTGGCPHRDAAGQHVDALLLLRLHGHVAVRNHIGTVGDARLHLALHQVHRDRTRATNRTAAAEAGGNGTDIGATIAGCVGCFRRDLDVLRMHLVAIAAANQACRRAAADLVERDRRADTHAACHGTAASKGVDAAPIPGVHADIGDIAVEPGVLQLRRGVGGNDVGGDAAAHRHAARTGPGDRGGADQVGGPGLDIQARGLVEP